ncbi:hypothetical protein ACLMJK_005968 [Lecanora helva]
MTTCYFEKTQDTGEGLVHKFAFDFADWKPETLRRVSKESLKELRKVLWEKGAGSFYDENKLAFQLLETLEDMTSSTPKEAKAPAQKLALSPITSIETAPSPRPKTSSQKPTSTPPGSAKAPRSQTPKGSGTKITLSFNSRARIGLQSVPETPGNPAHGQVTVALEASSESDRSSTLNQDGEPTPAFCQTITHYS